MEWLWLLVSLLGLGALWLIIMGLEKLVTHIKASDDARRAAADKLEKRIANEEENFAMKQAAKEYLLASRPVTAGSKVPTEFAVAMDTLSSDELLDTLVQKAFGNPQDTQNITATQSAFAQQPAKMAVAKGKGVLPVKAKRADDKTGLTKAEQKMLKKIKQGS